MKKPTNHQPAILAILADAQFHSSTEIVAATGISRAAISKQLKKLAALGLEYTAVSGKGYRLTTPLQLVTPAAIKKNLSVEAAALISALEVHDTLDSTNRYLLDRAQQTASNGVVCLAHHQSAGKGRRGRRWVSPFGNNIYLSIAWCFEHGTSALNGLSLAVGVAVIRALKNCGIKGVGLKWPNDVMWNKKKLAGILIEVAGESGGPCDAVIGLGLNFYLPQLQAQAITQEWVDLHAIINHDAAPSSNALCAQLLNQLLPIIARFEQDTLSHYIDEWRAYDCMQGQQVELYQGAQKYTGVINGVDDNGCLLLTDEQAILKQFSSAEVSFCAP